MRRARRLLIVLFVLAGIIVIAGRIYLGSARVVRQVCERLESVYGGRVALSGVDIGFTGSDLHGIQLFEAGPDAPATPWASARDVDTGLTLWDIVRGQTSPDDVTLTGLAITLRFDRDGQLLTRFPEQKGPGQSVGVIHVRGGQVTLQQEGRADLTVSDITADIRSDGNRMVLTGSAVEPRWGSWSTDGFWDRASNAWALTMKTPSAAFTQAQLDQLPFVKPNVWEQLRIDGTAAVDLTLTRDERMHYRLGLDVNGAKVFIAAIDLHAEQVAGRVVIDDRVVHLTDIRGKTADGTMRTAGDLDFRDTPNALRFKIAVERLQLRSLPAKWFHNGSMVRTANGRLSGEAELSIKIQDGCAHTSGQGKGILNEVRLGLLPWPSIRLRMQAEGKEFSVVPDAGTSDRRVPTAEPATWVVAETTWTDADLHAVLASLDVTPPVSIEGRLCLEVSAALPLDSPGDPRAYRLHATARLPSVSVAGVELRDVRTKLDYQNGVLEIADVTGRVAERLPPPCGPPLDGTFAGSAHLEIVPARDLTTRLRLDHVSLASLNLPATTGSLSANLVAQVPLARLADSAAWIGSGHAAGDDVIVQSWSIPHGDADLDLHEGSLTLTNGQANVEDGKVTGTGSLALTQPLAYTADLVLHDAGPATLQRIQAGKGVPALSGHLDATAHVHGQLRPFSLDAEGTASAADLHLGRAVIDRLNFHWHPEGEQLRVSDLEARLYQGQLTGSVRLPLSSSAAGSVDLRYQDIDLGSIGKQLLTLPARLKGNAFGAITGVVPTAAAEGERAVSVEVQMQAPRVSIGGLPTRQVQGNITFRSGATDYHLSGDVCGGRFHLDGRLLAGASMPSGLLRVNTFSVRRFWEEIDAPAALRPLRGHLDLDFRYGGADEPTPGGIGHFVLNQLRWENRELAQSIDGDLVLRADALSIRNVSGLLEQGTLRAQGSWYLREPERSSFSVNLEGADPGRILAPWPELASKLDGALDLQLFSRLGAEWSGNGAIALPRGSVAGVEVADARLPFDFLFVPAEGRGRLDLREGNAQLAHGRATSRASLRWGSSTRLEGDVRFINLDLRSLLRLTSDAGGLGSGQLTGRLSVDSQNLRSAEDVTATLDATLQQTQALEFPIFRQLTPYLAPGQSSAMFQTGEVKARLSGGVVRIERLRLVGSLLQFIVEGTITLAGQLHLDVNATTGRWAGDVSGVIDEVARLLAGRLIHLRVDGTVRSPVITVEPVNLR